MTHVKSNHHIPHHAVVIGGGFSGLASAALLAKQGWQVTVLEKNNDLGGRARVFKHKGFSFDMGPSWYMMPEVFEQFFQLFGKKTEDYYQLIRLDPRYQVHFEDGSSVTLHDNLAKNMTEFDRIEPGAGEKLQQFLHRMEQVYNASTRNLMYQDVWSLKTWSNPTTLRDMWQVITKLRLWESWHHEVSRHFQHPKLQKILTFPAVFLGGSPFTTPALYSLLTWSDFGTGIWYPKGGMGKVVEALTQLAREHGVKILTNQEATQIEVLDGQVIGVRTRTNRYPAQIVVGATDLPWVETQLLSPQYQTYPTSYWAKKQLGISALMIYVGVNTRYRTLHHHHLYFSDDWKKNFQEIFETHQLPEAPSLYISVRSKTDRLIVPKNSEEIVVLVPLGAGLTASPEQLQAYSQKIISQVEKTLNISITSSIKVKEIYTPMDFSKDYHAYNSTALGLAHTLFQSLWFRPLNHSRKVRGLYYAGQYTNPGVGVPMAFVSAQMIAKMIGSAPSQSQTIFQNGSTTYYYSSLFFRGQVKKDVFALYAYVRIIDDCVDELPADIKKFEQLWKQTQLAWNGKSSSDPIVKNFVELAKRKHFEWEWIQAFWTAMRSDLHKKNYRNFSELETYMYGSAEVIGLMMAKILNLPPRAIKAAAKQGQAMQFVNFIRDVKEDEELGRNYLGYSTKIANDQNLWADFVHDQIKRYKKIQKQAETGYQYIPRRYRIPIKTAADMYNWTANQIDRDPRVVWSKKIKPSKWRVLMYALKNCLTG